MHAITIYLSQDTVKSPPIEIVGATPRDVCIEAEPVIRQAFADKIQPMARIDTASRLAYENIAFYIADLGRECQGDAMMVSLAAASQLIPRDDRKDRQS